MTRSALIHALALPALVLALAACRDAPEPEQRLEPPPDPPGETGTAVPDGLDEAERTIDTVLGARERREAAAFPCDVVSREEVQTLTGNFVQAPFHDTEEKSHQAVRWTAERCSWVPDAEGIGVDLAVSRPQDFASGAVECVAAEGEPRDEDLAGLAGLREARWHYQKSFGRGTLGVCAEHALVEVVVDGPMATAEDRLFEVARAVAERALGPATSPGAP